MLIILYKELVTRPYKEREMLPVIFKILTPKVLKGIMDYVFKENELDQQMGSVRSRLEKLEEGSHPPRSYIVCDKCSYKIKQYEGTD